MPAQPIKPYLSRAAEAGVQAMLAASGGQLGADQIAVCACVYDQNPLSQDPGAFAAQTIWEHRGTAQIYPASLCKMFYLVALAAFQDAGRIVLDDEDHRAVRAMIGLSSNDATTYLLGRLTGAFDGPMMAPSALQSWLDARQQVQDWLNGLGIPGLAGINLLHSTYEDSPYGRAKQARLARPGNTLSARAGAAMLHEMLRGALPGRDWMAGHMSRDWQRGGAPDPAHDPDGDQVLGFLSAGIPADFRVWSKAGHTSATRHDIACLSAPDGRTAIVSVMTEGRWTSRDQGALPAFARAFVENAFA